MQAGMTAVTIGSRLKELRKYLDSFDFEKRKYARKFGMFHLIALFMELTKSQPLIIPFYTCLNIMQLARKK
jgi:hypothetical protein